MTIPIGRTPRLTLLALALASLAVPGTSTARESMSMTRTEPMTRARIVVPGANEVLHGGVTSALAKAAADSFNLYGGKRFDGTNDRRPEGQFQNEFWFPRDQGWIGVDLTEQPTFWNISTFNAQNLDPLPDNRAYWSGVPAGTSGFLTAPGYGNNWNDILQWRAETNPTLNTQVRLTFDFNYDLEPGYDYFVVEYDSAGVWIPFDVFTGSNKDASNQFVTPVSFDQTVVFTPLMYTGTASPRRDVRLRVRVISDVAYSDEDGLYTSRGAVQLDNVQVRFNGAPISTTGDDGLATFGELSPGVDDTEGWIPVSSAFAGDFAKVLIQLRDIDPCRQNITPMLSFIDDGTPPRNAPDLSTGGSTSPNWNYGVLGGWVVNYSGGVSGGEVAIANEWWSPEIAWDDTTTTEDDGLRGGALVRFSIWQHLPLSNGLFWTWRVRSLTNAGWTPWADRGFVYYGDGGGEFINTQFVVTDLLAVDREAVQMALGMIDLADLFGFPGTDATPSPAFDNVSVWRYDSPGPAFAAREIGLFNDGFPNSGEISTANLAALSVRMDAALDINPVGALIVPGDSIVVDVTAAIPGTALASNPSMKWVLEANPLFDPVRQLPPGVSNMGPGARGWTRWMGTVAGDSSRTSGGIAVPDKFFFDLPNDGPANANAPHQSAESAMFFPGDVIRYFLEATDTDGNTATLPADTTGFLGTTLEYSRVFTVRALPTIETLQGDQPEILVINDFGHRGGENDFLSAFQQVGMFEGFDFDTYTVKGPSSLVSNGIGSAGSHGASGAQLTGYTTLIYMSGDLQSGLISDGTDTNGNDKGPDSFTLQSWAQEAGDRNIVFFGDNVSSFMASSGPSNLTFLNTFMGVDLIDNDVRDEIGGLSAPLVSPSVLGQSRGLSTSILAYGGCIGLNQFDSIRPQGASQVLYDFVDPTFGGQGVLVPSGGVVFEEALPDGDGLTRTLRRVTFPFGFNTIYNPENANSTSGVSARSLFLQELLTSLMGPVGNPNLATGTGDTPRAFRVEANVPNPFNPSTSIAFSAPRAGEVSVRIFNVRGELVRTLLDGRVEAGEHTVQWNGTDDRDAPVASGVYMYRVDGFGESFTRKMALVK